MLSQVSPAFVSHTESILAAARASSISCSSHIPDDNDTHKHQQERLHQLKSSLVPCDVLAPSASVSVPSSTSHSITASSAPNSFLQQEASLILPIMVNSHPHVKESPTSISPQSVVSMSSPRSISHLHRTPSDDSLLLSAPNRILSFRECERILSAVDSYVKTLRSLTKQFDRQDALQFLSKMSHPFVEWVLACHRGFMHNTIRWIDQFSRNAGHDELVSIEMLLSLYSHALPPTTEVIEAMECAWSADYDAAGEAGELGARHKLLEFLTRPIMNAQGASMLFDDLKQKLLEENWIGSLTSNSDLILGPLQPVIVTLENVKTKWKRFNANEWIPTLESSIARFHVDEVEGVRTSVHHNHATTESHPLAQGAPQQQQKPHWQPSDELISQDDDHDSPMQDELNHQEDVKMGITAAVTNIPARPPSISVPPSPSKLTDGRQKSVLFASGRDILRFDRDEAPINCNKRVKSILCSRDRTRIQSQSQPFFSHITISDDMLILRAVQPTIIPAECRQGDIASFQSQLSSPNLVRSTEDALDKDDFIRCAPLSDAILTQLKDGFIVGLKDLFPSGRRFYPSVSSLRKLYFDRLLPALLFQHNPYISHWSALWMQVIRFAQELDEHKPKLSKLQACVNTYLAPLVGRNWSSPEVENRNWQLQPDLDRALKQLKENKETELPPTHAKPASESPHSRSSNIVSHTPSESAPSNTATGKDCNGQVNVIIAKGIVGKFVQWDDFERNGDHIYGDVSCVDSVTNSPKTYRFHKSRVLCYMADLKPDVSVAFDLFKGRTQTFASAIRLSQSEQKPPAQVKGTTATLGQKSSSSSVCSTVSSSSSFSAVSVPMSDSGYPFPPTPVMIRNSSVDSIATNDSRASVDNADFRAVSPSNESSPSKRQKTEGGYRPVESTFDGSIYPYPPQATATVTSNRPSLDDEMAKRPLSPSFGSDQPAKSLREPLSVNLKRPRILEKDPHACEWFNFRSRGCRYNQSECRSDHMCAWVECPDRLTVQHCAKDCNPLTKAAAVMEKPKVVVDKPKIVITLKKDIVNKESHTH